MFLYYSNFVIPHLDDDTGFSGQQATVLNIIIVTNIYALALELPMIAARKWRWFTAIQNQVNVLSNCLQLYNAFNVDRKSVVFWRIHTWLAVLIWWRFVLYLRTFERFSWMVRLVQQSLDDMKYFMLVFVFIVLSFADSFLTIKSLLALQDEQRGVVPEAAADGAEPQRTIYNEFFKEYIEAIRMSYLTSIGEFDEVFWKYDLPEWLIFFLSTIVNVIVLLNSLIALTGETFTIIYESQVPKGYQEKVLQMSVLQDGFRFFFWDDFDPNERLFVAR